LAPFDGGFAAVLGAFLEAEVVLPGGALAGGLPPGVLFEGGLPLDLPFLLGGLSLVVAIFYASGLQDYSTKNLAGGAQAGGWKML
jgi:hypothetical protein